MATSSGNISSTKEWIGINFNIDGVVQTQRFLRQVSTQLENFEPALTTFGDYMEKQFTKRFNQETGRTKWVDLSPVTAQARGKGYGYYAQTSNQSKWHKILQWTGGLFRSFTQRGSFGNYFNVTGNSLAMGSVLKVAGYHHRGGGRLPQRQVAFIDSDDNKKLNKIFHLFVRNIVNKEHSATHTEIAPVWVQEMPYFS